MSRLKYGMFVILNSTLFVQLVLLTGALLRLGHYLQNKSLWLDECYYAVQLINSSFYKILHSIPFFTEQQNTPLIYNLITKVFSLLLGEHEMGLRFWSVCSGCLALILFYRFSKNLLDKPSGILATVLFALNPQLIYFSGEFKPYSQDVLVAITIYFVFYFIKKKGFSTYGILGMVILLSLSIWMSYASIFLSAGILWAMGLNFIFMKDIRKCLTLILSSLIWLTSFYVLYHLSFAAMVKNDALKSMWGDAFQTGSTVLDKFNWLMVSLHKFILDPIGVEWSVLGGVLLLIGASSFRKKDKFFFNALIWPFVAVLCAGILEKYPFRSRMLLFLLPAFLIFLAQGMLVVCRQIEIKSLRLVVSSAIGVALFLLPVKSMVERAINHYPDTNNREIMQILSSYYQPGDKIYVTNHAQFPFQYYARIMGLEEKIPKVVSANPSYRRYSYLRLGRFSDKLINCADYRCVKFQDSFYLYYDNQFLAKVYTQEGLNEFYYFTPLEKQDYFTEGYAWLFVSHIQEKNIQAILDILLQNGKIEAQFAGGNACLYLLKFS